MTTQEKHLGEYRLPTEWLLSLQHLQFQKVLLMDNCHAGCSMHILQPTRCRKTRRIKTVKS